MSIITLSGIEKVYRTKEIETTALENVNLEVNEGEFLSIMGPSGCGKSTFLNIIGLLDKATKGSVSILGNDCSTMSDRELSHFRNANIGFVFQSFHLIPSLDVASNVELPLIYRKGISAAQRRERIEKVLERLDMSHRIHHLPSQLSCGHCPRHCWQAQNHTCRRTDRQPRQQNGYRGHGYTSPAQQRGRHHYNNGNSQRGTGA